jgi:regulatory protein
MAEARKSRGRGGKGAMTATTLENAALHYLGRFATSSANLRRVLLRKVARAAEEESDRESGAKLVDALIARYRESGLLNDKTYAAQAAVSLARRGRSRFSIGGKLAQKGVETELVKEAIKGLEEEGATEIAAACALVRRRRMGPYRLPDRRLEWKQKDLATLARAGFRLDLARRVLAAADVTALEALAKGEDSSD